MTDTKCQFYDGHSRSHCLRERMEGHIYCKVHVADALRRAGHVVKGVDK